MRTRDRIVSVAALGLALGLTPAFAFEGTTRAPAEVTPAAPSISRAVQNDVPRPPGMIPRAGGGAPAGGIAPASVGAAAPAATPNAVFPRPRAPVPSLSGPDTTLGSRPLPPPTAIAAPAAPIAPLEALRSGVGARKGGPKHKALV